VVRQFLLFKLSTIRRSILGDELITSFIFTIEELREGIFRRPLDKFGIVPETVKQAILYGVDRLYEQREIVDIKAILLFLKSVLFSYRQEEW